MRTRTRNELKDIKDTYIHELTYAHKLVGELAAQCLNVMDSLDRERANKTISHKVRTREGPLSDQCKRLLRFLRTSPSITCYGALALSIGHLPRRILDLKEHGYTIITEMIRAKNAHGKKISIAQYSLEKSSPRGPS